MQRSFWSTKASCLLFVETYVQPFFLEEGFCDDYFQSLESALSKLLEQSKPPSEPSSSSSPPRSNSQSTSPRSYSPALFYPVAVPGSHNPNPHCGPRHSNPSRMQFDRPILTPCKEDYIPNLHIRELYGLDISNEDLAFAMEAAAPPEPGEEDNSKMGGRLRSLTAGAQRWEALTSKVWKARISEHLPENILASFAPVLLGVYHPEFLLITTPSYTFNARFTAPDAPTTSQIGFPDPTGWTDRIFRHDDHKFEWTREEFQTWCQETANQWGYEVNETAIGRALHPDPWQRDQELQGATQVAAFRRVDRMSNEEKGRSICVSKANPTNVLQLIHPVNPAAMLLKPLEEIATAAKEIMEKCRLSFMRMEEL